ncbi:MAG: hypothetical protein EOQ44_25410 [Mesorhizobium sp.]|uniref:hypothetical protein n=1 Tax=Mesorhizobium sp. TaxID=1871066 RepID=UPI000FE49FBA|nr:hypothetical protein [Mesorhizobium sp.]RWB40479.1 MAG: hypothetical protein EOQ44_25410 [Mesorhizobium sp.]
MQIKMQAVLAQSELEEAVRLYVRQELPAADGQNITVEFEDDKNGNLTAIVVIDNAEGGEAPATANQKPKTTRKKAAAPATAPAEQASEQKTAEIYEQSESAAEAAQDLPWKEDEPKDPGEAQTTIVAEAEKPVTQPNEIPAETAKLFTTSEPAAAPAATNKIFPDPDSSAAPSAPPKIDPAAQAKSLFANLTKPTQ